MIKRYLLRTILTLTASLILISNISFGAPGTKVEFKLNIFDSCGCRYTIEGKCEEFKYYQKLKMVLQNQILNYFVCLFDFVDFFKIQGAPKLKCTYFVTSKSCDEDSNQPAAPQIKEKEIKIKNENKSGTIVVWVEY